MSSIKDSGARREFESGAVRDIQEGKGRCDLLPLRVIASLIKEDSPADPVLSHIDYYMNHGGVENLLGAIHRFCEEVDWDICTAILEVSKHYEEGAKKYAERNWEKGIPLHCFIDSGVRHYIKFKRGDKDEPHDRAFIWNMLGAVWTHQNRNDCIDVPFIYITKTSGDSSGTI